MAVFKAAYSGQKGGIFYWVICLSRFAISVVDFLLDILFGFTIQYGTREEQRLSEEYQNSAQVVNVMARGTYSVLLILAIRVAYSTGSYAYLVLQSVLSTSF